MVPLEGANATRLGTRGAVVAPLDSEAAVVVRIRGSWLGCRSGDPSDVNTVPLDPYADDASWLISGGELRWLGAVCPIASGAAATAMTATVAPPFRSTLPGPPAAVVNSTARPAIETL
ncbi:MAG: hypothetical protein ACYDC2_02940 [Solirubrobacteraceae bacterium]